MENVEDIYPTTSMQELMLLRLLAGGESNALKEQFTFTLRGDLDVATFQDAWQGVVERHAILRTAFLSEDLDRPVQVVHRDVEPEWVVEDWRDRADKEQALDAFLRADEERAFDPTRAPLLRFALLRISDDETWFLQSMHHILMDRWSAMQIFAEAVDLYEGARAGRPVELAPVRRYRDFVEWIGQQSDSEAEAYWRGLLAGFRESTRLPLSERDASRPAPAGAPERHLTEQEAGALQDVARRQQVTLNTLVRAAWGLVLGAASGRDDVVFGVTVSGRPADLEGVEQIVGLFINNLPVRVKSDPGAEIGAWLRDVLAGDVQARRFEHTPLAFIEDWTELAPGNALFESLLVFQSDPVREADADAPPPSIEVVAARGEMRTAYPLTLAVFPRGGLSIQLSYDTELVERETVEVLLDGVAVVLRRLAQGSDGTVGDLHEVLAGARALAGKRAPRAATPIVSGGAHDEHVEARTDTERAVAKVWRDVLGLERVSVKENFFDLGGSSVQAIRAIARVQKEAGIQLGAASFMTQTLAQVAASYDAGATGGGGRPKGKGFLGRLFGRGRGGK
jgi:hypothetical protein